MRVSRPVLRGPAGVTPVGYSPSISGTVPRDVNRRRTARGGIAGLKFLSTCASYASCGVFHDLTYRMV